VGTGQYIPPCKQAEVVIFVPTNVRNRYSCLNSCQPLVGCALSSDCLKRADARARAVSGTMSIPGERSRTQPTRG